ncbi:MAG: hypothetical protein ACFFDC_11980 [Promethearchaeota archaeon]
MNEIKKQLKDVSIKLKRYRIGSGFTLGTKKIADVLKDLILAVELIQKLNEPDDAQ